MLQHCILLNTVRGYVDPRIATMANELYFGVELIKEHISSFNAKKQLRFLVKWSGFPDD